MASLFKPSVWKVFCLRPLSLEALGVEGVLSMAFVFTQVVGVSLMNSDKFDFADIYCSGFPCCNSLLGGLLCRSSRLGVVVIEDFLAGAHVLVHVVVCFLCVCLSIKHCTMGLSSLILGRFPLQALGLEGLFAEALVSRIFWFRGLGWPLRPHVSENTVACSFLSVRHDNEICKPYP